MLAFTRTAIRTRRDVLDHDAGVRFIDHTAAGMLAFFRGDVVVLTNTTSEPIGVPADLARGRTVTLSSSPEPTEPVTVPPDATIWLKEV